MAQNLPYSEGCGAWQAQSVKSYPNVKKEKESDVNSIKGLYNKDSQRTSTWSKNLETMLTLSRSEDLIQSTKYSEGYTKLPTHKNWFPRPQGFSLLSCCTCYMSKGLVCFSLLIRAGQCMPCGKWWNTSLGHLQMVGPRTRRWVSFWLGNAGACNLQLSVLGPFPSRDPGSIHQSDITFLAEMACYLLWSTLLAVLRYPGSLLDDGHSIMGGCFSSERAKWRQIDNSD